MFAGSRLLLPISINFVTLVPKPGTRKPARRHATRPVNAACGACQVARRSSSSSTSSAHGHEAGARGSLPAPGPGAGWRSAGHPELTWPGGIPRRSPIDRPRPADEDGSTRWPGGLRGPVREDSGGVRLGAHPVAGAPDSPADGGSAGGRPTATCRKPPGLWRPQAGHPPTGRPQPRAATTTLPLRRARGQRPTVRDGPAAPGRLPQVAPGRVTRRRGGNRSGGAGAVHRPYPQVRRGRPDGLPPGEGGGGGVERSLGSTPRPARGDGGMWWVGRGREPWERSEAGGVIGNERHLHHSPVSSPTEELRKG